MLLVYHFTHRIFCGAMQSFRIPRDSFTGLRLSYLNTTEITETSKSVFIGHYPRIYLDDESAGLLSDTVRLAKLKVRKALDESISLFNQGNPEVSERNLWYRYRRNFESTLKELISLDEEFDSDISDHEHPEPQFESPSKKDVYIPELLELNGTSAETVTGSVHPFQLGESRTTLSRYESKRPRSTKARRRMDFVVPEPITDLVQDIVTEEKEHHRFRKKLKNFATKSKGRAKKTTKGLTQRVYNSVIRSYRVGEVILKEQVLVMIKETLSVKTLEKFEEKETCDTKVAERWKIYIIILRKTLTGVVLQFYDYENKKNTDLNLDEEKPEHEFDVDGNTRANFYSTSDKSLSISIPKPNWCIIYIVKFHSQMKSIRWLYFIKQALGDYFSPEFKVHVPDLDVVLDITLPESVILESVREPKFIQVDRYQKDYKVHHSPLIQYILDLILAGAAKSKDPKVVEWGRSIYRPWLCFRDYDRLEWIADNSEQLFVQNQVLRADFMLELRDVISEKRIIEMDGIVLEQPPCIEGFLSRLTGASGNDHSMLRTFYKVLYFNTADHLLFFTKYYRSLPPDLPNDESQVTQIGHYPLDDQNHVPWFDSSDFLVHDKIALADFQRKSQLVVRADSVIDLTTVVTIKPVPPDKVKLAQKILLGMLWYGKSEVLHDESLIDSAFEITTLNQGVIRLQAPNRFIRDEWVRRLLELRDYWCLKRQSETDRMLEVRDQNIRSLKIDEYVDSNINLEDNLGTLKRSFADPYIHGIDGIALSNHVLMSGYLYEKNKKHSNFNQYFVVLSSGCLILYSLFKRSKITGEWKRVPYFHHFITISLSDCYVYWTFQGLDLVESNNIDPSHPGHQSLPRVYVDGWKSQEEESTRCFTLWFGRKRGLSTKHDKFGEPNNPNIMRIIAKLGITGQSLVFMARSRQEREMWVSRIDTEIDRYSKVSRL